MSCSPWQLPLKSLRLRFRLSYQVKLIPESLPNKNHEAWCQIERDVSCSHGNWPPSRLLSVQKGWTKRFLGGGKPGGCATMTRSKMMLPYLILAEHQAEFLSLLPLLLLLPVYGMLWTTWPHTYHQDRGAISWCVKLITVAVI